MILIGHVVCGSNRTLFFFSWRLCNYLEFDIWDQFKANSFHNIILHYLWYLNAAYFIYIETLCLYLPFTGCLTVDHLNCISVLDWTSFAAWTWSCPERERNVGDEITGITWSSCHCRSAEQISWKAAGACHTFVALQCLLKYWVTETVTAEINGMLLILWHCWILPYLSQISCSGAKFACRKKLWFITIAFTL